MHIYTSLCLTLQYLGIVHHILGIVHHILPCYTGGTISYLKTISMTQFQWCLTRPTSVQLAVQLVSLEQHYTLKAC